MSQLSRLSEASNAILKENYKSILAAENMIDALERQNSAILLIITGNGAKGEKQFSESESEFLQWFTRAKDNITIKGEKDIIDSLNTAYNKYLFNCKKIFSPDREPVTSINFDRDIYPNFLSIRQMCVDLRELNQNTMFTSSNRAVVIGNRARLSLMIIGIIAICIGIGFSLVVSNLVVRPVLRIKEAAQKIMEGDYDIHIAAETSDEIGQLTLVFNEMVNKLRIYRDMNIDRIVAERSKNDAIIRSIDDGIIVVDNEFRITNINPSAVQSLNLNISKEITGEHFLGIIQNEVLFHYIKETVQSAAPCPIEDKDTILTIDKGGDKQHYQYSITPVLSKSGTMLGVVLLLRNITKLKEIDRLKSEFVMAASHELRTPLTSIIMSVELLRENAILHQNENVEKLLGVIHEELQRLKILVNDLLDLSKIESGKLEINFEKVNIQNLVERAIALLKTQALESGVKLETQIAPELPLVFADANKITWVLTNLIANALRYTDIEGHILVQAGQIGSLLHVSVIDDGIGIPYELQSKIFDKFVQVKGTREAGGSGLGLSISREIIRAHSGTIWVESTPGEGSVFTFTLPVIATEQKGELNDKE
ncbi:MAG TPA: ATP-binding protein [bacterium]|nr:ATP-binding protein [bacterium]HPN44201.1 ATP-binding protein [bacterium]